MFLCFGLSVYVDLLWGGFEGVLCENCFVGVCLAILWCLFVLR